MSAVDVRVFLEGKEIPAKYIQGITISQATNTLNRAVVNLSFSPTKPPFEIRKDGPIDILIVVNGQILFQGVVLAQSQTKTSQGTQISLSAISSFSLLNTLRIGLLSPTFNPANIPAIWIAQMGGTVFLPKYLSPEEKGAVAYDVTSLIFNIVKKIKKRIDNKDIPLKAQHPIRQFLEELLKLDEDKWKAVAIDYGQACKSKSGASPTKVDLELEGKEWWKKVHNKYKLSDRIVEYSPFTVASIRFFFPPGNLAEIVHAIFQGAMFSGQTVMASLQDILFAFLSYMLLNFIEVSTEKGIALVPKPRLLSALPPKSNILPPYAVQGISLSIADSQVPTRTLVVPNNMAIPNADPTVIRIASSSYIVAYPEEIEKKSLLLGLKIMEKAGLVEKADPHKPLPDLAQEYYTAKCSMPKPVMAVISEEEKKRGIIPNTVQVPTQLQALVDQFLGQTSTFKAWLTLYGWAAYNHLTLEGQAKRAQVQSAFNPWALVDHTVVFSDGNQIYMGHAEEITHVITPTGAYTTYQLSHVKIITEEFLAHVIGGSKKKEKEKPQKGELAEFDKDDKEFFGEDFTIFDLTASKGVDELETPDYEELKKYHKEVFGIEYKDEYDDKAIANYLLDRNKPIDFVYTTLWPRKMAEDIKGALKQMDRNEELVKKISDIIDTQWL